MIRDCGIAWVASLLYIFVLSVTVCLFFPVVSLVVIWASSIFCYEVLCNAQRGKRPSLSIKIYQRIEYNRIYPDC